MSGGVIFFYRSVNPLSHQLWHDVIKWPEVIYLELNFSRYSNWSNSLQHKIGQDEQTHFFIVKFNFKQMISEEIWLLPMGMGVISL